MKIMIATDSFKCSLSAQKVCDREEKSCIDVFPQGKIVKSPMTDGGIGCLSALGVTKMAEIGTTLS